MINTGVSISTRHSASLMLLQLLFLPLPEASLLASTHSFCEDPHKFRELMCQEGQHGCEGTQSSSKQNKEGKLLLWVNWDFMESCGEDKKEILGLEYNAFSGNFCMWDGQFSALAEAFCKWTRKVLDWTSQHRRLGLPNCSFQVHAQPQRSV